MHTATIVSSKRLNKCCVKRNYKFTNSFWLIERVMVVDFPFGDGIHIGLCMYM